MKVQTNWNLGNFTIALAAEAEPQAMVDALLSRGLLHAAQRVSEIDKIMGAFTKVDGKAKRKEGWKRGDVPYSPELAEKLAKAFAELEITDDAKITCEVNVGRYDGAGSADSKEAQKLARAALEAAEASTDGLEKWLADRGYNGPTHDDKGEYHPDVLALALARAKAAIAKQKAAMMEAAKAGM